MYRDAQEWPALHTWLTAGAPQPLELARETAEIVLQQAARVRAALAAMHQRLQDYRPDVVVILASVTERVFTGVQIPQLSTFLGDEIWGSTRFAELQEVAEDDIIRLPCAPELASFVQRELVRNGFDMSYSKVFRPLGQPEYGASPAFVAAARALQPALDVPVVPIYVNTRLQPAPNGRRCYAFGHTLADILSERTERVALLASGGLSHDHHGPRAGWIDEPLDRWLLDQLCRGKTAAAQSMFDLESDVLQGGAAEVRLWLAAAGAAESLGGKATVVDYFPSYTAATGLGFVYWDLQNHDHG
jgi:protocatechuate 4,5-dioxygenase beta chain